MRFSLLTLIGLAVLWLAEPSMLSAAPTKADVAPDHYTGPDDHTSTDDRPPNLIVILVDDLGYGDIGPFGGDPARTPALNRMAQEGRKFTDFVVSSAVCSASRAALLTGCYHQRVGISGALGPRSRIGLAAEETTLAELCRAGGYATACFGKWHLGDQPQFLPLQQGFDEYYGIPYSNDMWPLHPAYAELPPDAAARKQGYPPLPMYEGNEVCDPEMDAADQSRMTAEFTRRSVDFIRRNRERPFFLYLAHPMVHVPLFAGEEFRGRSSAGPYADVIAEVDASAGSILQTVRELGLEQNTWVVFTSDNGPWLSYGDHAGSAGGLREGKGTSWEGGVRVPTVMWWPGQIPPGSVCDELASTIDLLPTMAAVGRSTLPDRPVDGKDIRGLMTGLEPLPSPHTCFWYYYAGGELQAVRDRQWKLVLPHSWQSLSEGKGGTGGRPAPYQRQQSTRPMLFDLKQDRAEEKDVAAEHPAEVQRLMEHVEEARMVLGDRLTGSVGNAIRPAGDSGNPPAPKQ